MGGMVTTIVIRAMVIRRVIMSSLDLLTLLMERDQVAIVYVV
jgi:hypothetical protein